MSIYNRSEREREKSVCEHTLEHFNQTSTNRLPILICHSHSFMSIIVPMQLERRRRRRRRGGTRRALRFRV